MLSPFEERELDEYEARMKQILVDYESGLRKIEAKYSFRSHVVVGFQGVIVGFVIGFLVACVLMQHGSG